MGSMNQTVALTASSCPGATTVRDLNKKPLNVLFKTHLHLLGFCVTWVFSNSFRISLQRNEAQQMLHPRWGEEISTFMYFLGRFIWNGLQSLCFSVSQGLYMIRFHSFYPWHSHGDYMHLCNDKDRQMLPWVKEFKWVSSSSFDGFVRA